MLWKIRLIAVVMVLLAAPAWAFAEIKEGLWEITSQTQIEGMPMSTPPVTFRQCLNKKEAVPQNRDKGTECKIISQKISGDTITYTSECKNAQGNMRATGKITYSGNTMEGKTATAFSAKGQAPMQMTTVMKGKYLGPCNK
jgi:hypothetical protein